MTKAVITGDLIGFSTKSRKAKEVIISEIQNILETLSDQDAKYEMYRGDSIQGVLPEKDALRHMLYIKSAVNAIDTKEKIDIRLSVGIGEIEYMKESIGQSEGPAFHISGRNLDNMKYQTLSMASQDESFNVLWHTMLALAEEIIGDWTTASAKVVNRLLLNETETTISGVLGISQPAVNKHKKQAGWYAIEKMLNFYNQNYK